MKYETKKEVLCVDTGETICVGDIVNIEDTNGGGCGHCKIVKITDTGFHFSQGGSNKSIQYKNIKQIDLLDGGGDNVGRLTEKDGSRWQLKNVPWEVLGEGQIITKDVSDRVYGALCKLKDYEDTEIAPDKIELLKYHHDERILNDGLKMTLKRKIKELKGSSDYPHNFKGQMVEDFEWVLSLLK